MYFEKYCALLFECLHLNGYINDSVNPSSQCQSFAWMQNFILNVDSVLYWHYEALHSHSDRADDPP